MYANYVTFFAKYINHDQWILHIFFFLKNYDLHYFAVVSKFRSPWIFKFFSLIFPLLLLFLNESPLHLLMLDKNFKKEKT